jgi:hypothetical protein
MANEKALARRWWRRTQRLPVPLDDDETVLAFVEAAALNRCVCVCVSVVDSAMLQPLDAAPRGFAVAGLLR